MINLENSKKQAKQYVRWHRERLFTVAQVIREALARYGHLSDREIFEAPFQLADAQELVAKRSGFEDWSTLLSAARQAAEAPRQAVSETDQPPKVLVARPFVFVRDVRAACAYYVDKLGFTLVFDYGSPPYYAEVERDGVRVCVRHTDQALIDPAAARREEVIVASLEVTDAKALYRAMHSAGATFSQTLRAEPYGTRGFIVDDPDGNRILFFDRYGQRSDDAAPRDEA